MYTIKKNTAKVKTAKKVKKAQKYAGAVPERIDIDDISDWLPSWAFTRNLSEAELRRPLRGRSL